MSTMYTMDTLESDMIIDQKELIQEALEAGMPLSTIQELSPEELYERIKSRTPYSQQLLLNHVNSSAPIRYAPPVAAQPPRGTTATTSHFSSETKVPSTKPVVYLPANVLPMSKDEQIKIAADTDICVPLDSLKITGPVPKLSTLLAYPDLLVTYQKMLKSKCCVAEELDGIRQLIQNIIVAKQNPEFQIHLAKKIEEREYFLRDLRSKGADTAYLKKLEENQKLLQSLLIRVPAK